MSVAAPLSPERVGRSGLAEIFLWSTSLVFVSSAFAAAMSAATHWQPAEPETGAPPPTLMIEFAPLPSAPTEEPMVAPAAEEAFASHDLLATNPPQEHAEPGPTKALEPEPILEREIPAQDGPEGVAADPVAPPEVQPAPDTEPSLTARVEIPTEIAELRQQAPRTNHTLPPSPPATAPSRQTAPAVARAETAPQIAAPETTTAPPTPTISPERWQSQLFAHLNRYKQYPPQARSRREQGIAYVQFRIDTSGRIISSQIVQSSGSAVLDTAIVDLMRNASPVPPPPSQLGGSLTFTVPIEFTIR